jgi:GH25 family lysozyme M1 (1,4-beta-N-acetylmuramidase)
MLSIVLALALFLSVFPKAQAIGYDSAYDGGQAGDGNGITAHGVDISVWQGKNVDFHKIKADGYSYVILRAGYSTSRDSCFEDNYARAKAAGLDVGVYLYSYAATVEQALAEAAACKSWLDGKRLEYPVYFDLEDPETHGDMSKSELTALAMAFLDSMAADGWLAGLYSCESWLYGMVDLQQIGEKYECWMARYPSSGTYSAYYVEQYDDTYGMWQYTSFGQVDGYPGNADLNICFKDYPAIVREYGFNGYRATGETLVLTDAAAPEILTLGKTFLIGGKVTSFSENISNVTIAVYDEAGTEISSISVAPDRKEYELAALAGGIDFSNLLAGSYEYRVSATNDRESKLLLRQRFAVSVSGAVLTGAQLPSDMKEGQDCALTGTVSSNSNISNLTVGIFDASGAQVMGASVSPNAKLYHLKRLSQSIRFDELTRGEYRFRLDVQTAEGNDALLDIPFCVWVANDPIALSFFNPGTELGGHAVIAGSVKSQDSLLTAVRVTLYDVGGRPIMEAGVNPEAQSYALEDLALSPLDLPSGMYRVVIDACNAGGPVTLLEQSLVVAGDDMSLCGLSIPAEITQGDSLSLSGVVTSEMTDLKSVCVSLIDQNGYDVCSAAELAQGKTFDLAALNDRFVLSSIVRGEYRLRITGENGRKFAVLYEAPMRILGSEDTLNWSDARTSLRDLSIPQGATVNVYGTLVSRESNITSLAVGVLDADGKQLMGAEMKPNTRIASVSVLNQTVKIAALSPGTYRYVVTAQNAQGSCVVTDEEFSITECAHKNAAEQIRYDASCAAVGALCDSRCADCGGLLEHGRALDLLSHTYSGGVCNDCGAEAPALCCLQKLDGAVLPNGRYCIAATDGVTWYALGADGSATRMPAPNADGTVQLPNDLLWKSAEMRVEEESYIVFSNDAGQMLHLDSAAIRAASGVSNAALIIRMQNGEAFIQRADGERALAFFGNEFKVAMQAEKLVIFALSAE